MTNGMILTGITLLLSGLYYIIREMKREETTKTGGNKKLSCDYCDKHFPTPSKLDTHTRTHTGENPFTCDKCHKSFNDASNLTRHKRTHSGEKPFTCSLYCFAAASTLWTYLLRT